jgi:integrase
LRDETRHRVGRSHYRESHLARGSEVRETYQSRKISPRDLRRTCARLCHVAGGELEQIQFLLGHVSVQTTEQYLGCKQRFLSAVNHHIGIEPDEE